MNNSSAMPGSSEIGMDFDFMDEMFLDGCWLETNIGPDLLVPNASDTSPLNSSFPCPSSDPIKETMPINIFQQRADGVEKEYGETDLLLSLPDDLTAAEENPEWSRRIWLAPECNLASPFSVMERLMKALSCIKQSIKERNILVQIWVPETRGAKRVLSIHEDLVVHDPSSWKLATYREVSSKYHFPTEEDSQCLAGLPGRVFLRKIPEWTPDVRFFRSDEYPRVDYAHQCEVSGSLALPVFEQGSMNCLGVIEFVTTEQKIKYHPELEILCKALEDVDLRSEALRLQNSGIGDASYKAALPEIRELLKVACDTHQLLLAQTWVPCVQQQKEGCRHSDENYTNCVSTLDDACHVADPAIRPFHEACSEHHLLKGQGVTGGAFLTNQPCFSSDITQFTKTQYPLAHHAKVFNLRAAVAIRLRCLHTKNVDFVLEFFLPADCRDAESQKQMLSSLSNVIRRVCHSLRVVTGKELEDEATREDEQTADWMRQVKNPSTPQSEEHPSSKGRDFGEESRRDLWDGASCSSNRKSDEKKRNRAEKAIPLDVLRQYFAGSLKDAARSMGVCPTTLKRICRRHGIQRWPSRKIKKVGHSLQKIQSVINSAEVASCAVKIGAFYNDLPAIIPTTPSAPSPATRKADHPSASLQQPEIPLSPCSQSSSSSHSCSSGSHNHQVTPQHDANSLPGDFSDAGTAKGAGSKPELLSEFREAKASSVHHQDPSHKRVKRVGSNQELNSRKTEANIAIPRSQSHLSLKKSDPPPSNHEIDGCYRVKVAYDGEKVRFRMPATWRFSELRDEVARRFCISDPSESEMKYLDDDFEWVLLTCDADLRECVDICRSTDTNTIRLMVQAARRRSLPSQNP